MANSNQKGYTCPRCGVGRCQPTKTTFIDVFADQILSIPNVSANICDVCHFAEFDQSAIESLWDEIGIDDFSDEFPSPPNPKRSSSISD